MHVVVVGADVDAERGVDRRQRVLVAALPVELGVGVGGELERRRLVDRLAGLPVEDRRRRRAR
jgi:hypothetical protein